MKKSLRRNKRKLELMLLSNPEYFNHQARVLKKEIDNAQSETPQEILERETVRRTNSFRFADEWESRKVENNQEDGSGLREDIGQIDDG
jgi:hypothetical protein